jgi:hypothetical protein
LVRGQLRRPVELHTIRHSSLPALAGALPDSVAFELRHTGEVVRSSLPCGVVVSHIGSPSDTKPAPILSIRSNSANRSVVLRPSRSNLVTMTRSLAKIPGAQRIREASSLKVTSRA